MDWKGDKCKTCKVQYPGEGVLSLTTRNTAEGWEAMMIMYKQKMKSKNITTTVIFDEVL